MYIDLETIPENSNNINFITILDNYTSISQFEFFEGQELILEGTKINGDSKQELSKRIILTSFSLITGNNTNNTFKIFLEITSLIEYDDLTIFETGSGETIENLKIRSVNFLSIKNDIVNDRNYFDYLEIENGDLFTIQLVKSVHEQNILSLLDAFNNIPNINQLIKLSTESSEKLNFGNNIISNFKYPNPTNDRYLGNLESNLNYLRDSGLDIINNNHKINFDRITISTHNAFNDYINKYDTLTRDYLEKYNSYKIGTIKINNMFKNFSKFQILAQNLETINYNSGSINKWIGNDKYINRNNINLDTLKNDTNINTVKIILDKDTVFDINTSTKGTIEGVRSIFQLIPNNLTLIPSLLHCHWIIQTI